MPFSVTVPLVTLIWVSVTVPEVGVNVAHRDLVPATGRETSSPCPRWPSARPARVLTGASFTAATLIVTSRSQSARARGCGRGPMVAT